MAPLLQVVVLLAVLRVLVGCLGAVARATVLQTVRHVVAAAVHFIGRSLLPTHLSIFSTMWTKAVQEMTDSFESISSVSRRRRFGWGVDFRWHRM